MKARLEYNKRKLLTLRFFERAFPDFVTPQAYAWQTECLPSRRAYTYLKGLWKWGLLERRVCPVYYRISPRGRSRLAWLVSRGVTNPKAS
jgi:hypothetical protein